MKKTAFIIVSIFILTGLFFSDAFSGDVTMQVKDYKYDGAGKVVVHYSLVNTYGFEYQNVTLGFKVTQDGKPIGCHRIKQSIPKDANDSETIELVIDADTGGKQFGFQYVTFYGVVDYRKIEAWFNGCN